jgi:hypothetical protein
MKLWLESFAGLLMTIGGFVAGAFLTTLIPGAGGKYMSPLGEFIVAAVIFATTLGLAIVARFARSVLFLTLGFTAMFEVIVLTVLSGGHWWGDFEEIWDHTLLPVALSATAVAIIRTIRDRRSAEPDDAANASQPIRPETSRSSSAAGSRR